MDRLSIVLALVVGSVATGTLIIAVLTLGWYSWPAIAAAIAVGALLTLPASYAISRRIKRQDPNWDETKADKVASSLPATSAREV